MAINKLKDLTPNARNPRKITDEKKEMLRKSLDEFGDLSGIVFNVRSNQLIGGHQRGDVLPEDSNIIITQKYDSPTRGGTVAEGHVLVAGEKFKYREVDWDANREKAAMIAANKHGGEWDFPVLNDIMLELDQANYEMDLTGFSDIEIEQQMTYVSGHERALPGQSEDAPEPEEESPVTSSGITKIIIHLTEEQQEDIMPRIQRICQETKLYDLTTFFFAAVEAYEKQLYK